MERGVAAPTLVFDGDCGFCSTAARWAGAHLGDRASVEPAQRLGKDGLDRLGLSPEDAAAAAWWVDPDAGISVRGHRAIGEALVAIGGRWRLLGRLCLVAPTSWVAAAVYGLTARLSPPSSRGDPGLPDAGPVTVAGPDGTTLRPHRRHRRRRRLRPRPSPARLRARGSGRIGARGGARLR